MARGAAKGPGKRVRMNREALDAITLGYADGLQEVAVAILERTRGRVPDAPPLGTGLVKSGMAITLVDRKKVAAVGPTATVSASARPPAGSIASIIGFGFPGRFVEIGTVHMRAQPFLTPAFAATVPSAAPKVTAAINRRLAKVHR